MSVLWEQFTEALENKGTSIEQLLRATEAELEEIFTQYGYRALERAQLRTAWYDKKSRMGVAEMTIPASTTVVPNTSREFGEVKVLLEHYVGPDPSLSVSIVELERVANPALQKRFERRKGELSGGGGGGAVVRRFHSPVSFNGAKIQDVGFSLPAEGAQMCLRFLTKAPAAHLPGAYKLLLCDVAVGKYKAVNGDGVSITPEQLVSEAYDSVYLFYGGKGTDPATPDEFILFHPDQVLPQHVVTFLIHPALASPMHSSPTSPNVHSHNGFEPSLEAKRELTVHVCKNLIREGFKLKQCCLTRLLFLLLSRSVGGLVFFLNCVVFQMILQQNDTPQSLYWLRDENRLVNGDSLLVGEHRGKRFVSLAEGTEMQVAEVGAKREVLLRSIEHLRGQLTTLEEAAASEAEAEARTMHTIEEQTKSLLSSIEARKVHAVKAVQDAASAVKGRIAEDHAVIEDLLASLEAYSEQVASAVEQSHTQPKDFLLKSDAFLHVCLVF